MTDVLSYQDLLGRPEKVQPLGSKKGVRNLENKHAFIELDMEEVFLSGGNLTMIARNMHKISKQNGGKASITKWKHLVAKLALIYVSENNLNEHKTVEYQSTGFSNHAELLKTFNADFMRTRCYNHIRWNNLVPTRAYAEVGVTGKKVKKKYHELTAEDIPTLDFWREQETQIMNKQFRYGNKIPIWQTSMHTRHYDRGNDGLKHRDQDRASLDVPVRGYKMDNIYDALDKWKSDDWFGFGSM